MTMEDEHADNGESLALNEPGDMEANQSFHGMDLNHYATKKSAAQSMLDVALLMANSSQLKTVLYVGPQYCFYIPLVVLLALSITLQVIVGLLLMFIVKYNLNDRRKHAKLDRMNDVATVFVFFTVLINIFITALGFQEHIVSSSPSPVLAIPEPKLSPLPINLNVTI
ncbi:ninjurin-1 isoform X2 [Melanotaenia boesemani]|uniref:ninjurin-1 isoform X2 n=1 Tax=Melanotaenia boesemani TaxID=1250792 RepID=UPI001C04F8D1|nr:ninjurin-1 isoform X2 [Melanotaenia boesemani]